MTEAFDSIREAISAMVRQRSEKIEEACERSLTDPKGRGVLVVDISASPTSDNPSENTYVSIGRLMIYLSSKVPYGNIYFMNDPSEELLKEWTDPF